LVIQKIINGDFFIVTGLTHAPLSQKDLVLDIL